MQNRYSLLIALLLGVCATSAVHADGTLDPGFGGDGFAVHGFQPPPGGSVYDDVYAACPQADGKLHVVAEASNLDRVITLQLNPDGSRDPAFGPNGERSVPLAAQRPFQNPPVARVAACGAYGRTLVARTIGDGASGRLIQLFLLNRGALESSYGNAGVVTIDPDVFQPQAGEHVELTSLTPSGEGYALLAGEVHDPARESLRAPFLARISSSGDLEAFRIDPIPGQFIQYRLFGAGLTPAYALSLWALGVGLHENEQGELEQRSFVAMVNPQSLHGENIRLGPELESEKAPSFLNAKAIGFAALPDGTLVGGGYYRAFPEDTAGENTLPTPTLPFLTVLQTLDTGPTVQLVVLPPAMRTSDDYHYNMGHYATHGAVVASGAEAVYLTGTLISPYDSGRGIATYVAKANVHAGTGELRLDTDFGGPTSLQPGAPWWVAAGATVQAFEPLLEDSADWDGQGCHSTSYPRQRVAHGAVWQGRVLLAATAYRHCGSAGDADVTLMRLTHDDLFRDGFE